MAQSINKTIGVNIDRHRNSCSTIVVKIHFKQLFIAIRNRLVFIDPSTNRMQNTITIQFGDTVLTTTATTLSDLEHAVTVIGFHHANAIPAPA